MARKSQKKEKWTKNNENSKDFVINDGNGVKLKIPKFEKSNFFVTLSLIPFKT